MTLYRRLPDRLNCLITPIYWSSLEALEPLALETDDSDVLLPLPMSLVCKHHEAETARMPSASPSGVGTAGRAPNESTSAGKLTSNPQ